jgi:hypothetical protein
MKNVFQQVLGQVILTLINPYLDHSHLVIFIDWVKGLLA